VNDRRLPDEFDLIARYFAPLTKGFPGAFALGDDAAVIHPEPGRDIVATADTMVADVHFLNSDPPAFIARKLLRVNLSDLAAMGARPRHYLLTLALPKGTDSEWVAGFAAGLAEDQELYGITLAGGDTVATSGPATLTLAALGDVPAGKALRRSGAQKGDRIYVTGTLGDGALGLAVLQGSLAHLSKVHAAQLVDQYHLPRPRLAIGRKLIGCAHAAIDISDGLVADLGHVAGQSGFGATVEAARLPLSAATTAALEKDSDLFAAVLGGGDDYELLFTAAQEKEKELASLAACEGVKITCIGRIEGADGVRVLDAQGAEIPVKCTGYRHF